MDTIGGMNNVSFGASLKLGTLSTNKARWEKIAKSFEKRTSDVPDFTFCVADSKEEAGIVLDSVCKNKNFFHKEGLVYAEFFGKCYDELMKLSDRAIVSKLKKVMKLAIKNDEAYQSVHKLEKSLELNEAESEKIWDVVATKTFDSAQEVIKTDEFLNDKCISIA